MAEVRVDVARQPVVVAERGDGGLCGMIEVLIRKGAEGCHTDRVGYIEGWYVDPEWRRRGVGWGLAEAAEVWARSQGCAELGSDRTEEYPLCPAAHWGLGYEIVQRTIHFRKELV